MKNISIKRFLACTLVLLNILAFVPVASAAINAEIYDVRITGNFVTDGVLTAEFSSNANISENDVSYKWMKKPQYNNDTTTELGTGKTYTLTSGDVSTKNSYGVKPDMWVEVTYNEKTYFSGIYGHANKTGETYSGKSPEAKSVHIVPLNAKGSMEIGDTIAARFTYSSTKSKPGAHLYAWYAVSTNGGERVLLQAESTKDSYTITKEAFGKWIECDVTPVEYAEEGETAAKGNTVTTRNHYANYGYLSAANMKNAGNAFRSWGNYPSEKILADGASLLLGPSAGSFLQEEAVSSTSLANAVIDIGEEKLFDGFFLALRRQRNNKTMTKFVVEYSETAEDGSWVEAVNCTESLGGTYNDMEAVHEKIFYIENITKARYFRFNFIGDDIGIAEFYPFLSDAKLPTITLKSEEDLYLKFGDAYPTEELSYVAKDHKGNPITATVEGETELRDALLNNTKGSYKLTYTATVANLPSVVKTRTVHIDTGVKTPGDLAYKSTVISQNATDSAESTLTDGNSNTLWLATALPASATIELDKAQWISRFTLKEATDFVTEYAVKASQDGKNWEIIYSGDSLGDLSAEITPVYAKYIKIEIISASELPKLSGMEIFLPEEDEVLAAEQLLELEGELGNLYSDLSLPTTGEFDTTISWESSNTDAIADSTSETPGKVTRLSEKTEVKLTATISNNVNSVTKEFTVVVAKDSVPKALDVHITGNFVDGETLTAHYTYYDEAGIPEDTEGVKYQWYRATNFSSSDGSGAIKGATEKTYTLTEADRIFVSKNDAGEETRTAKDYNIYVVVTPKSMATDGKAMSSAYSTTVQTVSTVDVPVIYNAYITSASPRETMLAGDTLACHYSYQERGLTPEGETTFMWQVKDTEDGNAVIRKAESTDNTYTLTEDDFGKVIECVITPKTADGITGKKVTAKNHYGNAFSAGISSHKNEAAGINPSWLYYRTGTPAAQLLCYEDAGYHMTSGGTAEASASFSYNMGEIREFDTIYMKVASSSYTALEMSISEDGKNYTALMLPKNYVSAGTAVSFKLDSVKRAQYIHVKGIRKGYLQLWAFYPYLSSEARGKITLDSEEEDVRQFEVFTDDSFTATDPFGNNANHLVETEGSVNTQKLGSYKVKYTLKTEGYPDETAEKTFRVVEGIPTVGDLAYDKKVSSEFKKLVDGNPNTTWTGKGTENEIVIDFGKETGFSKIMLGDVGGTVTGFDVLYSDNGADNWKMAEEFTSASATEASFAPVKARYVKLIVKSSAAPKLHSAEVFVSEKAKVIIAHKELEISGDLGGVTEDLALPVKGEYDIKITWESSNTDAITTDGVVKRGSSEEEVTLTATISNEDKEGIAEEDKLTLTKTFTVTVAEKETSKGSGGGGGGGSSKGSSGFFAATELVQAPEPIVSKQEPYKIFADVPDSHWAAEFVNALAEKGIVSGRDEKSFSPENDITRAEYLKLLIEGLGITFDGAKAEFSDVSENDWYYKYVAIAYSAGIANGVGDGYFCPNSPILRRDMAVLAEKALKLLKIELRAENEDVPADFDDISEYAKEAVKELSSAGIINGNENGEFMPDEKANRAQSSKIIFKLLEASGKGSE